MKISVIVPVYNYEKYLNKCIDSILSQTFTDFELLLINDGSTDRSGEICDMYSEKDERVKVFHKENGGVSSARNVGLENVKGEFITFVDSDDDIMELFLETVYKEIKNVDIVYQGIIRINNNLNKDLEFQSFENKIETVPSFFNKSMVSSHGYVLGKIFKKQIIKNNTIRFDESVNLSEDSLFILEYLKYVVKIRLSCHKMYRYHDTPDSLVKIKYSFNEELNLLNLANEKLIEVFRIHQIDPNTSIKYKESTYYLHRVLERLYNSDFQKKDRLFRLKILLLNFRGEFLKLYRKSKGRGLLVYYSVLNNNTVILDYIFIKLIYN